MDFTLCLKGLGMHPHTLPMVQLTSNDLVKCNILAAHSLARGMFTLWQFCFSEQCVRANQNYHLPQQREGCCPLGKPLTQSVISGQLDLAFPWHVPQDTERICTGQGPGWTHSCSGCHTSRISFPFLVTGAAYPALPRCGLFPFHPASGKRA